MKCWLQEAHVFDEVAAKRVAGRLSDFACLQSFDMFVVCLFLLSESMIVGLSGAG